MDNICFCIMPFADGFEDINDIIAKAAADCKLTYVRGDHRNKPGSVLEQIVNDIKKAAVVVADITGNNPNVFYELGIAHQIKGPDKVVIITQSIDSTRFDVSAFRQLHYSHNKAGRQALRVAVRASLQKAVELSQDEETWNVVRSPLARTLHIVRDLKRVVDQAGPKGLKGLVFRITAGLGSLAISNREADDESLEPGYYGALLEERDLLRKALLMGARLKAVINPPRRFAQSMRPERLKCRYERLIGLFKGRSDLKGDPQAAADDVRMMKQCEFVLSPVYMPNRFIIGDLVAYEGIKLSGRDGYEATHGETSPEGVNDQVRQFDRFFANSRRDMIATHPPDGRLVMQLESFYKEAVKLWKRV